MPGRDALQSGEPFHLVKLRQDNTLVLYATQVHRGEAHMATTILGARQTPAGSDLVVLSLMPAADPKDPMLSVVSFRLGDNGIALVSMFVCVCVCVCARVSMHLLNLPLQNTHAGRCDIELSASEYAKLKGDPSLASLTVTSLMPGYHVDYAFVTLFGRSIAVSLATV